MELKTLRMQKGLTQKDAAQLLGISLRSYSSYENDETRKDTLKYRYLVQLLSQHAALDEEHGVLTAEDIAARCREVFAAFPVEYCYLFGSYAKGTAGPQSDVDLLISTSLTGLAIYELTEKLRCALHKKVDLLETAQLQNNLPLMKEILRDGVRIYG